jgi:DNA repair exonuclease SbcCD ATPase subunit
MRLLSVIPAAIFVCTTASIMGVVLKAGALLSAAACPCCTQTPEGQPPDIWRRLPQEALQAALQFYKNDLGYPEGALRSMAWAAAQHSLELDCELRREVVELRDTVAGLESQLQQRDDQLQQQDERLQQQDQRLQQQDKRLQQQDERLQLQDERLQQQDKQLQQHDKQQQEVRAGLESRWEQDDRQQQEVADLKAMVATMGAQLQALLLQSNMQQG